MKKNKFYALSLSLLSSFAIGAVSVISVNSAPLLSSNAVDELFALTLDSNNKPTLSEGNGTLTLGSATFTYTNASENADGHVSLSAGGTISKDEARGLKTIKATFEGAIIVHYGYEGDLRYHQALVSGSVMEIKGNAFYLEALTNANIASIELKYDCREADEVTPHNYQEEWKITDTEHYHECDEPNCSSLGERGEHVWVEDDSRSDKEPTYTEEGLSYVKCSTCAAQGQKLRKYVNLGWVSNDSLEEDGVVISEGTGVDEGYTVASFNKITQYRQPLVNYGSSSSLIDISVYNTLQFSIKNTLETNELYLKIQIQDSGKNNAIEEVGFTSLNGKSSTGRLSGTYISTHIKAGDEGLFTVKLIPGVAVRQVVVSTQKEVNEAGAMKVTTHALLKSDLIKVTNTNVEKNRAVASKCAADSSSSTVATFENVTSPLYGDGVKVTFTADVDSNAKFFIDLGEDINITTNWDSDIKATIVDGVSTWTDSYKITGNGLRTEVRDSLGNRHLKSGATFRSVTKNSEGDYSLLGSFSDIGWDSAKTHDENTTARKIAIIVRPGVKARDTLIIYNLTINLVK